MTQYDTHKRSFHKGSEGNEEKTPLSLCLQNIKKNWLASPKENEFAMLSHVISIWSVGIVIDDCAMLDDE